MNFSRTRIGSWLNLFAESLIGQEAEAGTIGVQIPGLLKEDGSSNNRGNVIVAILPSEAADMMAELRTPLRDLTPAEMVRRTLEIADGIVSFKTSAASGTRTRQSIQGSGQKSQKSQLVVLLMRELVGELGLADSDGRKVAEPGEYSPVVDVRIDKQNRGKTGQFQQFLLGSRFAVRDIERE